MSDKIADFSSFSQKSKFIVPKKDTKVRLKKDLKIQTTNRRPLLLRKGSDCLVTYANRNTVDFRVDGTQLFTVYMNTWQRIMGADHSMIIGTLEENSDIDACLYDICNDVKFYNKKVLPFLKAMSKRMAVEEVPEHELSVGFVDIAKAYMPDASPTDLNTAGVSLRDYYMEELEDMVSDLTPLEEATKNEEVMSLEASLLYSDQVSEALLASGGSAILVVGDEKWDIQMTDLARFRLPGGLLAKAIEVLTTGKRSVLKAD